MTKLMLLHAVVRLLRRPTSTEGHFGADEVARVKLQWKARRTNCRRTRKAPTVIQTTLQGDQGARNIRGHETYMYIYIYVSKLIT
jgi:hypothetical protein